MDKFKEFLVKKEEVAQVNEPSSRHMVANNSNDVFITNEDEFGYEMPFSNNAQIDLLADLFGGGQGEPMQEEEVQPVETIETYISNMVAEEGIGEEHRIKRS